MHKTSREIAAAAALLLLSVSWGMTGPFRRLLQDELAPLQQLSLQTGIAFLLVGAVGIRGSVRRVLPRLSRKAWLALHVRVVLGGVAGISLMLAAYAQTKVAHVSWIGSLPFVVFWAVALRQEAFELRESAVLFLGAGGALLCCAGGAADAAGAGECLALGGSLLFSLGLVAWREVVKEAGVLGATGWSLILISIYAGALSLAVEPWAGPPSGKTVLVLGASGTLVALNSALLCFGFSHLRSSLASGIMNLKMLWAPLFALLLFDELPSRSGFAGGAIVVFTLALLQCCRRRKVAASSS